MGYPNCTCHPDDRPAGPCQRRYAASECRAAAKFCQSAELRVMARLAGEPRRLRCRIGFHRFAPFEQLITTGRYVCVRCGAVHLSSLFGGVTLNRSQSRAELEGAAAGIEAKRAAATQPHPSGDEKP